MTVATLAERLAVWIVALEPCDIPQPERARSRLRVLDTLGLILVANDNPAVGAARDVAVANGSGGASAVLGTGGWATPSWAAFAHGVAAHCRDFDDTFTDSVVHPGSVVVPVALAIGESVQATSDRIDAAIVVGYEVAARVGAAAGRKFHARGFHATGTVGPLAAAAAAGYLLRLDAPQLADAFGLAGSVSGGLMEFMRDGTWSKWFHTGWAAHGGIVAADLAQRGFRGPASVLEGESGLFAAFLGRGQADATTLGESLGRAWRGGESHFKYYPCAHVIQPYLDAALALAETNALAVGDIEAVTCWVAPWAVPIVCEPRASKVAPATELDAIASLSFQIAAALIDRRVGLATLAERSRTRADVRALAARVEYRADAALGRAFDGRIAIALRSGRRLEARTTSAPPDAARLRMKFLSNAAGLGQREAAAVADALLAPGSYALGTVIALIVESLRRAAR